MKGKRVQFDDEIFAALEAVAQQQGVSFQDLADEAFKDLLKKHHQPVGFKAALKESLGGQGKQTRRENREAQSSQRPMNSKPRSSQRSRASSSLEASI